MTTPARPDGIVYVLLPIHSRRIITEGFVRCLLAQTDRAVHLVLVDDGSTDDSAAAVLALMPDATVLHGTGDWWWAGSLQEAYEWLREQPLSDDDVVLIANDDTRFEPDFLSTGREVIRRNPRAIVLAQLWSNDSELVEVGVRVDWAKLTFKGVLDATQVNCFSTRGLFVRARDFIRLGGFHRHLLPHYLSDYEFTMRASRMGFDLRSDPALWLRYDETTTGIRNVSTQNLASYLRTTLSRRSTANPVYMSTFLLLACRNRHVVRNLVRVWRRFAAGAMSAVRD